MKDNQGLCSKAEKRTQRDYNMGFKLAVISQVEKGEMTYKQAQKAYGIQGKSTVLVWLRKHGTLNADMKNIPVTTIRVYLVDEVSEELFVNITFLGRRNKWRIVLRNLESISVISSIFLSKSFTLNWFYNDN